MIAEVFVSGKTLQSETSETCVLLI